MSAAVVQAPKNAGFLTVAKTVLWSFFGVRRRREHEADVARLSPAQVVIAGVIGGILFVLAIILVVRVVLRLATG